MTVTLRDGSRIAIRPLEPDDRELLAEGFDRLSPESRYRRFFAPVAQLRKRDLDYLTRVDHHDHEALVAVDLATGEGIGVARYVRTGPDVAEPAIVVADDWQGRGLGGRLLGELTDRARAAGVRRYEASALASNAEVIALLERLGDTVRRPAGHEVELTVQLGEPGRDAPLATLLRQAAAGTLVPARTMVELLWPRRRGRPGERKRNVIVVGTDGSAHALEAVEAAGALASLNDAGVEVVGVRAPEAVEAAAATLRDRGLHVHPHVRGGDPALALADVAAGANARLIVVGAGERSKTARRLIGGVADHVAERAPCDVLIVRRRASGPPQPPAQA